MPWSHMGKSSHMVSWVCCRTLSCYQKKERDVLRESAQRFINGQNVQATTNSTTATVRSSGGWDQASATMSQNTGGPDTFNSTTAKTGLLWLQGIKSLSWLRVLVARKFPRMCGKNTGGSTTSRSRPVGGSSGRARRQITSYSPYQFNRKGTWTKGFVCLVFSDLDQLCSTTGTPSSVWAWPTKI